MIAMVGEVRHFPLAGVYLGIMIMNLFFFVFFLRRSRGGCKLVHKGEGCPGGVVGAHDAVNDVTCCLEFCFPF